MVSSDLGAMVSSKTGVSSTNIGGGGNRKKSVLEKTRKTEKQHPAGASTKMRFPKIFPDTIFGKDFDYVFAYPSVKMVAIQDARLGVLKYLLITLIVLYVAIVQLWKDGGYLETEKVSGVARFTLQQPTVDDCSPTSSGCKNKFTPLPALSYCDQATTLDYETGTKYPCRYYDNIGLQTIFDTSIFVATRITERRESLVCDSPDSDSTSDLGWNTCPHIYNLTAGTSELTYYPADAESFSVLFDASVMATELDLKGESANENGLLYVESNDSLCKANPTSTNAFFDGDLTNHAPCFIKPNRTSGNLDYFLLEVLMQAAGSSLDAVSSSGNTYRYDGVTLVVEVEYSNIRSWSGLSGAITYQYTPYLLSATSYKLYDVIWEGDPTTAGGYRQNRTLLNKHGVKVDLVQSGNLAAFSFSVLLVSLTTSLTLLAVATVITDYVALYLMPDRVKYDAAKYEWTEDFSDIRDKEEKAERAAKRMYRKQTRPGATSKDAQGGGAYEGVSSTEEALNLGGGNPLDTDYRLINSEEVVKVYGGGAGGKKNPLLANV